MSSTDTGDWRNEANCASTDPEIFYDKGAADAIRTCGACVVKLDCLIDAIENGERTGVWGGTTERQRLVAVNAYEADPNSRSARDLALDTIEAQDAAKAARRRAA